MPTTISSLEEEIEKIDAFKRYCAHFIKELMEKEQKERVYFPKEIHELTQFRNMLETHREMRRVRISRLKMEEEF